MLEGFKNFLLRGNVIDLAVAVIIGATFKNIVDKFIEGVVNPLLGSVVGKPNFDDALIVGPLEFGVVLTAAIDFVLTAAVIYFFLVLPMNKAIEITKKQEAESPPEPSEDVLLLREIRDLLTRRPAGT